ncbi:MAG: DinB family protein [Hyphomicrobiaceae bacterium]|nr:DinB family protein [Hyphomicrobiaceae bacterium]
MKLDTHFRRMARNNAWSNWRLFEACSRLSPAEFRATRTSFFPSIQATFDHILLVDLYYLDALEGGRHGHTHYSVRKPVQELAVLRTDQIATDQRLIGFCDRLSASDLDRVIGIDRGPDGIDSETIGDTLSHLFVHQIHHRGQVHAMLAGTSVEPPQLDEYFLQLDAARRAPDLAALGIEGPEAVT